jgi:hypothetical protein
LHNPEACCGESRQAAGAKKVAAQNLKSFKQLKKRPSTAPPPAGIYFAVTPL